MFPKFLVIFSVDRDMYIVNKSNSNKTISSEHFILFCHILVMSKQKPNQEIFQHRKIFAEIKRMFVMLDRAL